MNISILGDSISTFYGVTLPGYKVYYRAGKLIENGLSSSADTWWAQVIRSLGGSLCVNNAYSGCRVSGNAFPSAFSERRIKDLGNEQNPDLILVYLGINDFGFNVPVRKKSLFHFKKDPAYFADAYDLMLAQIRARYPRVQVICGTLLKTYILGDSSWNFDMDFRTLHPLEDYNEAIRIACRKRNAISLELARHGYAAYETLDGAHPTRTGHAQIAACWIAALKDLRLP